jgi:hypothetical protein
VWTQITTSGTPPPARHSHLAFVVGTRFFVFGGTDGSRRFLGDLHVLDTTINAWSTPLIAGSVPPRCAAACAVVGSLVYIHGGINSSGVIRELRVFDAVRLALSSFRL